MKWALIALVGLTGCAHINMDQSYPLHPLPPVEAHTEDFNGWSLTAIVGTDKLVLIHTSSYEECMLNGLRAPLFVPINMIRYIECIPDALI